MNRPSKILLLTLLFAAGSRLSGCGTEPSQAAMAQVTQAAQETIQSAAKQADQMFHHTMDQLRDATHRDDSFENNLDSARSYLLQSLQEKYGVSFVVVGNENLTTYGPLLSYSCEAAPVNAPENITKAQVSQSLHREVRDNYARYYFKRDAEQPAYELCDSKPYVIDQTVSLEAPVTDQVFHAQDGISSYLANSGAYIDLCLYFEDNLGAHVYAEQILDLLHSLDGLHANLLLQARANQTILFHQEIRLLDGVDPAAAYTLETLTAEIEALLSAGNPPPSRI